MKYVFPAVFEKDEDKIAVRVPDVKGCITFGDDMAEAMEMVKDALEMMLVHFEDHGEPIPKASDIKAIETNGIVSYVLADTDEWRKEFDNRAVKKTLTIPAWLNTKAEKVGVNFSQVLQEALKEKLGVA